MKRERIEDLGCIKILIEEALDMDIIDGFDGEENEPINALIASAELYELKCKLQQIKDYADGFEDES